MSTTLIFSISWSGGKRLWISVWTPGWDQITFICGRWFLSRSYLSLLDIWDDGAEEISENQRLPSHLLKALLWQAATSKRAFQSVFCAQIKVLILSNAAFTRSHSGALANWEISNCSVLMWCRWVKWNNLVTRAPLCDELTVLEATVTRRLSKESHLSAPTSSTL